jgi:predicted transcriptional regulator
MNELAAINVADQTEITELAAQIVSAYVAHNALSSTDLPKLIGEVHTALQGLKFGTAEEPVAELTPAVSIKKSISPDYLICLDDGKKFKSLKRHLTQLGMTPEQYRQKWNLPASYPMVAPNYSATRSNLALSIGLGRKGSVEEIQAVAEPAQAEVAVSQTAQAEVTVVEPIATPKTRRRTKAAATE